MASSINKSLLRYLEEHLEAAYPEEGAGFLLGNSLEDGSREFTQLILLKNEWQEGDKTNRFMIQSKDVWEAEERADAEGLTLLGVFHSHPDSANIPSEFDRQWALPWFSYIITTVTKGAATNNRLWRLKEDRSAYWEEALQILAPIENNK
jgi:proteasome lid subunit RPN8/RPN11